MNTECRATEELKQYESNQAALGDVYTPESYLHIDYGKVRFEKTDFHSALTGIVSGYLNDHYCLEFITHLNQASTAYYEEEVRLKDLNYKILKLHKNCVEGTIGEYEIKENDIDPILDSAMLDPDKPQTVREFMIKSMTSDESILQEAFELCIAKWGDK